MTDNYSLARFTDFIARGTSGGPADVDLLMNALASLEDLATTRLVDYALSLVDTRAGRQRLNHYLFNGTQVQRNYAALYFKRRGIIDPLDEAVAQGKIDREQAFSR
jgi:hypothetical protein